MANLTQFPPVDDATLEAVTEAMVKLHERYYRRRPASAHTQMMGDDMLACLFGGIYTDVEKTLIELQRQALVHESRTAFQRAIEPKFINAVEQITGREVDKFVSTHHVGPDLELALFFLAPVTRS